MIVKKTKFKDLLIVKQKNNNDRRGNLRETFNNKILNIASLLLNDIAYFSSMDYHNKAPGGQATPPHQDNFYWCRKPKSALTAYIALNNHSPKN